MTLACTLMYITEAGFNRGLNPAKILTGWCHRGLLTIIIVSFSVLLMSQHYNNWCHSL
jgi:ABC-type transport system involved in cytochrome c biogenesis permease component